MSSASDDLTTGSPWERALGERVMAGHTVVASVTGARDRQRYLDLLGWADRLGLYVYIGRPIRRAGDNPYVRAPYDWSNPFKLGRDGDRDQIMARYENEYLPGRPDLLARLDELRGRVLGCWCAPDACHGDVLARLTAQHE